MTAWPPIVERIRKSGNRPLGRLLDSYQTMRFSRYSTCWVPAARRLIAEQARRRGIIAQEDAQNV